MDQIAEHLDDIRDAESDFLSAFNEEASKPVGSIEFVGKNKIAADLMDTKTRATSARSSFINRQDLDGHENEGLKLASLIEDLWRVRELQQLSQNENILFRIADGLQSSEKEQLFMSGGNFIGLPPLPKRETYDNEAAFQLAKEAHDKEPDASRSIKKIMDENYQLTHSEYCNSRSWTRDFSEATVQVDDRTLTFRDVGGDELNREMHWDTAIKDSFCTLFLISLSDYTKDNKMKNVRHVLWTYLIMEEHPKIIMLLNKKDLFAKKLQLIPLHTGCKEFETFHPQGKEESDVDYCERCEGGIIEYFNHLPSSVKETALYQERKKDAFFKPETLKLSAAYITQATDAQLFAKVKDELLGVFSEQLKDMLSDAF